MPADLRKLLAASVVACVVACTRTADQPVETGAITAIDAPAGPNSGEPNLAVDGAGRVHLSWLERNADSSVSLRLAVRDNGQWSTPVTVTTGRDLFVNWADFPSVFVAPSGRIVMHWLQRQPGGKYSYGVRVSQSTDGGASWSDPKQLHDDQGAGEHGFVSFFAADGDSVEAIWLDGRATGGEGHEGHHGSMQLGNGRIAADGGITPSVMVDDRICDCCQTSAAVTARGPVVVYRDRSAEEIRDIAIVRRVNGKWTEPTRVHADDWHIEGCPVNGPSVVADGDDVAVAWFTGARDTAKVNIAFSKDAGATFSAPVRVDDGQPAGRVDVEFDGDGRAMVTWLERVGQEGAEVRLRAIAPDGMRGDVMVVANSAAARSSGFPRMVRSGDELIFAWTQPGDTARVRMASTRLTTGQR
ncbi:MAG TPA: sialidase family protein [Gemmatimonadaceae bacterium]|nr:sialidase family protein [Gemmatimonadaceae bacterium]